jgi:hypothetical protein
MLESFLIYGVVASAEGDDARPRKREAVGFCPGLFQQRDVFCRAVVGVARYITRCSASNLAWDAAERVPDGVGSTVLVWSAFDLVTWIRNSVFCKRDCFASAEEYHDGGVSFVGDVARTAYLAVAKPHRKPLGKYESDIVNS